MHKDDKPWQTLSSKIVYQNPWIKVYEDKTRMPNGHEGIYGFIEARPAVFIIALTEDGRLHLIESFRHPTQRWQWELPAGGIDDGMSPLEAATQELSEELGMTAAKWTRVNVFSPSANGLMRDTLYVFVAEELSAGQVKHGDFEAIRATKAVSTAELLAMMNEGTLADGQSLAALMQFFAWRKQVAL